VLAAALIFGAALPGEAGAQTKVTDRWVTVVLSSEPPGNIDGCQSTNQFQGIVSKQNIVETLVERNPKDGSLEPRLATSWEQVDPTTWRFHLRQNVMFHDGSPFNAEAVKKSLERTLTKALVCTDKTKFLNNVELEATAIDELTLQLRTPKPEPILPMRLTGAAIVGPATPKDRLVLDPVGTGPYIFDSWQAGQQILLRRNEKYWGAKPQAEGVRYVWRDESSVRAAMVKIGEADIAHIIGLQDANVPDLDRSYQTPETTFLRIDAAVAPLNDKRVRLALNYAFDREAMRGSVLPKDVMHATQLVVPSIVGHNFELDKMIRPYDPAKARQLLAEAKTDGVPVDKEIILYGRPSGYPNSAEVMEAFLAMYKGIGLNVKVVNLEPGQYTSLNNKPFAENRGPSLLQSIHDNNSGDAIFTIASKLSCEGASSAFCDPGFDAMVATVSAMTGEERARGWQQAFRVLYEDSIPVVWMYHQIGYARVSKRINFVPDVRTGNEIHIQDITFN
jgi:peptide/nickel transport system substrate-binding protein